MFVLAYHWLPLATIDLAVIIANFKFEGYFGILYLLWVVYCLKTLKFHHCLSLVTTGYP